MKMSKTLSLAGLALAAPFACNGATTITFNSKMEVEIDGDVQQFAQNATFTATSVPCLYKMRPVLSEGERIFGIIGNESGGGAFRVPLYGDGNWVRVALADDGGTVTLKGYKASNVYYVDAQNGNDAWDGTADYNNRDESIRKGPKQTLQAAHDCAAAGNETDGYPVVLVAPGTYDKGVTNTYGEGTSYLCKRRLYITKNIGFVATEGADKTFIVGAPDPSTGGCGENAVSGVYAPGSIAAYLQGFTITGCYAPLEYAKENQQGAAFSATATKVVVADCVISNNFAVRYPANNLGLIQRSWIVDNVCTQWVSRSGYLVSCIVAGNIITYGNGDNNNSAIFDNASAFFTTFDLRNRREPSGRRRLDMSSLGLYSSFAYGLTDKSRVGSSNWHENSRASDDPVFADPDNRDYRLGMLSPALDASAYGELSGYSRRFMVADIDGRMPVLKDGKVRLGAVWNEPPLPVTVLNVADGGMSVSGGRAGTNVVASAEEITVTATVPRPLLGFAVNGELVQDAGRSYTFTPSLAEGSITEVTAVYDTNWYVDCMKGSDSNDGSEGRPLKTIRAATAGAVNGDVIHVAPGTYGADEGIQSATSKIGTRVVVPAGVTLASTEGAEKTFIVGAAATGGQVDNATYGTGTNAVRCVYAKSGAVVRGFTLAGGRGIGAAAASNNGYGAAFFSETATEATVEDCVISNNAAYQATIYQANVRRCRVLGNIGVSDNKSGAAGSGCAWYGSIINDNKGNGTIVEARRIESCTIGTNLTLSGSSSQVLYDNSGHHHLINSLFLYGSDRFQGNVYATNCVFRRAVNTSTLLAANCGNCLFNQSDVKINIDSAYRPLPGSVAIDAGANELSTLSTGDDMDIFSTPRVLNCKIDVGAVEYDWRPAFGAELGSRFKVDYASPSVTTNIAGGLLVAGGEVAGKATSAGSYAISFNVSDGSLAVYVGGTLVGESVGAGEQSIRFRVEHASDEIRFVVEAPGSVVLKKYAGAGGFSISFR